MNKFVAFGFLMVISFVDVSIIWIKYDFFRKRIVSLKAQSGMTNITMYYSTLNCELALNNW